jgi:IclR family mhp operon transcriptional activator
MVLTFCSSSGLLVRARPPYRSTVNDSSKYPSVRALARGLDILLQVSRRPGAKPAEIARALNLPRPSVYRLLETLEEMGYVARSPSDARFRVTEKTRAIAEGYDDQTRLSEVAGPVLSQLGRELVWPVDLTSYDDGAMVIRETTHARSPMSIDRNMIGYRLPVLRTASGRAWLSHVSPRLRDACLDLLRSRDDPADRPFLEPAWLEGVLAHCRQKGFGMRLGEDGFLPKTSSFGMPIMSGDEVFGCITVIWITKAITAARAEADLVPHLSRAADRIGTLLAEG